MKIHKRITPIEKFIRSMQRKLRLESDLDKKNKIKIIIDEFKKLSEEI